MKIENIYILVLFITCYFIYVLFLSRRSRLKRLAKKYSLSFDHKIYVENGVKKFNTITGAINSVEIFFRDEKNKTNFHSQIREKFPETSNVKLHGTGIELDTNDNRVSYLKIGKRIKKIGRNAGSRYFMDRSDLYMSLILLDKMFKEIKETGQCTIFDNLNSIKINNRKFISGFIPYVKEVDNQF